MGGMDYGLFILVYFKGKPLDTLDPEDKRVIVREKERVRAPHTPPHIYTNV